MFFFHTKLSTDRERACTRHTTTTKRDKRAQRRILGINCMVHMKSIIPKFEMAFFLQGQFDLQIEILLTFIPKDVFFSAQFPILWCPLPFPDLDH